MDGILSLGVRKVKGLLVLVMTVASLNIPPEAFKLSIKSDSMVQLSLLLYQLVMTCKNLKVSAKFGLLRAAFKESKLRT